VALLAFALQVVIIYFPLPQSAGILGERALLLLSSYALLIFVVIINYKLPGFPIIGLGLALNLLVMLVNGGFTSRARERGKCAGFFRQGYYPSPRANASLDVERYLYHTLALSSCL